MIYDCILNEMNVDELRNYAHHMNELDERRGELVFSQDELISAYKRALSCEQYRMESLNALNRVQEALGELSRNMEQKYEYAMPRPCCIESSKKVSEREEVNE
jgi:CDP-glycerol glycerophosphotransferase (TagB/SpsB family)